MRGEHRLVAAVIVLAALLAISGWRPFDRTTWWMEVAPILLVVPVLALTYRRFPLTGLLYTLIFLHALILLVGGAYTYARVPLGFWIQDALSLDRNPYDRIGHFAQGFVPAIAAREIALRRRWVSGPRVAAFLAVCVAMTISAGYELVEWGAAVVLGQGADEFLGTQGDPWDTQSDMLFCLIGSLVAIVAMARVHDRAIARLAGEGERAP